MDDRCVAHLWDVSSAPLRRTTDAGRRRAGREPAQPRCARVSPPPLRRALSWPTHHTRGARSALPPTGERGRWRGGVQRCVGERARCDRSTDRRGCCVRPGKGIDQGRGPAREGRPVTDILFVVSTGSGAANCLVCRERPAHLRVGCAAVLFVLRSCGVAATGTRCVCRPAGSPRGGSGRGAWPRSLEAPRRVMQMTRTSSGKRTSPLRPRSRSPRVRESLSVVHRAVCAQHKGSPRHVSFSFSRSSTTLSVVERQCKTVVSQQSSSINWIICAGTPSVFVWCGECGHHTHAPATLN